ncbi:MAG: hypothetical protein VYC39_04525 [Myxococcota bacterium]|nr:hypothetical protein [Myxococcota bacterium]
MPIPKEPRRKSEYTAKLERRWARQFVKAFRAELLQESRVMTSTLAAEVLAMPKLEFRIELIASHSDHATGILDLIYFQPFGPSWGLLSARVKVWAELGGRVLLVSDEEINEEFSHILHWYWRKRDDFREKSKVQKLYQTLLTKSIKNILPLVPDFICVMQGQTPHPRRALTEEELFSLRADFDAAVARLLAVKIVPNSEFVPQKGMRVIQSLPPDETSDSLVARYFGALGGLEVAQREGVARVTSRARNSSGQVETLGTGEARSRGYRVAFYQPPTKTGYFFPPSFGFLSQTITISGFDEDIPKTSVQNSEDIPGIITDPSTGDISALILDPISYGLELKSLYFGQGLGLDLVMGDEDVRYFISWQAALNLFEARHTSVQISTSREEGYSLQFAKSINGSGQFGVYFPAWHLAIRLLGEFEFYRDFNFPEPVDFQGRARFNFEKNVFERERIFVDGASLLQLNGQLSAVYVF